MAEAYAERGVYQVVFAVDERSKTWDTGRFPKVSITHESVTALGLYVENETFAWKCGDYLLYLVAERLADVDFVWVVEDDVFIAAADKVAFFRELDALDRSDLLGTYVEAAPDGWFWIPMVAALYKDIRRCFFPLVRVSRPAIAFLLAERRRIGGLWRDRDEVAAGEFPNDEVFVASALATGTFTLRDINELGPYYRRDCFAYQSLFNLHSARGGSTIYHSATEGAAYARKLHRTTTVGCDDMLRAVASDPHLSFADLRAAFLRRLIFDLAFVDDAPAELLRSLPHHSDLDQGDADELARAIAAGLALTGKEMSLARFVETRPDLFVGSSRPRANLAFRKPADQSSTCVWSRETDRARDAALSNDGDMFSPFGGHTDQEDHPWWRVDLGDLCEVTGFRIHNRPGHEERFRGFQILVSADDLQWEMVHADAGPGDPPVVISIDLAESISARFVKVLIPRVTMLHMRELEVLGRSPDRSV